MKFLKVFFIFLSIILLSGCIQTTAILGPSMTVATTGNVFQAGLQYGANTAIKNETGKNTLEHLKGAVESQRQSNKFKSELKNLVEKRFELTREKLKLN